MRTINPYLTFNGNCEEAFNFYRSVFGGEFASFNKFNAMPADSPAPKEDANRIMHISLPIGGNSFLMGSDTTSDMPAPQSGNNISISIHPDNEEETRKLFSGLSAGGQVTVPLADTFWGALFGMVIDKFGIHWMVNHDKNKK